MFRGIGVTAAEEKFGQPISAFCASLSEIGAGHAVV